MDGLLILLALAVLSVPVLVLVLLVAHLRLRTRVVTLEWRLADLARNAPAPVSVHPDAAASAAAAMPAQVAPPRPDAAAPPVTSAPVDSAPAPQPGRWAPGTKVAETVSKGQAQAEVPAGPIVMRADRMTALGAWLQRNWVYVVSATSLALAGVFLVQYSVQNGLLPPEARADRHLCRGPLALARARQSDDLRRPGKRRPGPGRDPGHRVSDPRGLRIVLLTSGSALALLYAGLEIRRFWRCDWLGIPGVTEPELYSYTIALMVLGAGLLWQAILRRSHLLRRIAMTVIALVIAKVFLIDAAGLTALTRVFSFLGLGLSLAGLAWVNRWADRQLSKSQ